MQIVNRRLTIQEWLDYVATYDFGPVAPDRAVLHHTWSPTLDQWAGQRSIDGLKRFYEGKGWTAAPHIFVGPDGIWLFTPMDEIGVHAGTNNSGHVNGHLWYSIGIEMVGNYDVVRPSGAVWENAKAVLGGLALRLNMPLDKILFHNDSSTKTCPGRAVTKEWVKGEVMGWLRPNEGGLTVVAEPRISQATFAQVLRDAQSPAAEWGNELWTVCQFEGIDPAVALAFFRHESTFGKAGICKDYDTKNWGNVRSPEDPAAGAIIPTRGGPFAKYSSWQLGLVDWCRRLKGPKYAGEGRMTVETIIPKYAPSSDNNNEQAYVNAVKADVAKWSQNVPATYTVRVTAQPRLRVRQGPSTRYAQAVLADKSLAWVNFDAHLECDGTKTEDQGPWHHLVGGLGYVSGEYVVKE